MLVSLAAFMGPFAQTVYAPNLLDVADDLDVSFSAVATTMSAFGLVLALSVLVYGAIIDRFSARRVLTGALVLFAFASMLAWQAQTFWELLLFRCLQAAGAGAGLTTAAAFVSDTFRSEERGRAMGLYATVVASGPIVGLVVGSVVAQAAGWRATFLLTAAGTLAVAVAIARYFPEMRSPRTKIDVGMAADIVRTPATAATAALGFFQFMGLLLNVTIMPALLHERFGVDQLWVGPFIALVEVALVAGSRFGGGIADDRGRRTAVLAGTTGSALAYLAIAGLAFTTSPWALLPLALALMVFGASLALSLPAQLAIMVEWFPLMRGTALGTYNFSRFIGATAGPLIGGAVVAAYSLPYAFVPAALGLVVTVAIARLFVHDEPEVAAARAAGK